MKNSTEIPFVLQTPLDERYHTPEDVVGRSGSSEPITQPTSQPTSQSGDRTSLEAPGDSTGYAERSSALAILLGDLIGAGHTFDAPTFSLASLQGGAHLEAGPGRDQRLAGAAVKMEQLRSRIADAGDDVPRQLRDAFRKAVADYLGEWAGLAKSDARRMGAWVADAIIDGRPPSSVV